MDDAAEFPALATELQNYTRQVYQPHSLSKFRPTRDVKYVFSTANISLFTTAPCEIFFAFNHCNFLFFLLFVLIVSFLSL